jgi:riboflavin transporter FmnP
MNTKKLTLTIVFAAVTVALNPAFTKLAIPAPYAPFLFYQIWEIPIVAAFVLISPRSAVAISAMNAVILLAVFPGALITGPFYNLLAVLSMLLGVYIAHKLLTRRGSLEETKKSNLRHQTILVTAATSLGIVFRVGIMTAVNYTVLRYPPPVGYSMPEVAVTAAIPLIGLFNATLALYTIPLGIFIAKEIKSNLRLNN